MWGGVGEQEACMLEIYFNFELSDGHAYSFIGPRSLASCARPCLDLCIITSTLLMLSLFIWSFEIIRENFKIRVLVQTYW